MLQQIAVIARQLDHEVLRAELATLDDLVNIAHRMPLQLI